MMRFMLLLLVALLDGADRLAAQETVEVRGITSVIKLEEVVYGHRPELNGKFKMRTTELTFAPDAYLGVHHHAGPGVRFVLAGGVTFTEGGRQRSTRPAIIFSKPGTLRIPRRTRRSNRLASCLSRSFRKIGRPRR